MGGERVVVIAPIPKAPGPGASPARQVAALAGSGSRVALVVPGAHAREAYGRDLLNPALRAAAARAGRAEAAGHAARVAEVWEG
jgi:NTE family protein